MAIGLVGALMLGGGVLNAFGALRQSLARKSALNQQITIENRNIRLADIRIAQNRRVGQDDEAFIRRDAKFAQGEQSAAISRGGIDPNFGTPLDLIADTDFVAEQNIEKVRENTANKEFELEIDKLNTVDQRNLLQAAVANENPAFAFGSSLLGSATNFLSTQQTLNRQDQILRLLNKRN